MIIYITLEIANQRKSFNDFLKNLNKKLRIMNENFYFCVTDKRIAKQVTKKTGKTTLKNLMPRGKQF